ncbi:hypothetical protein F4692_001111 [Nocardioides cavernae]|uniref:DUF4386 family protein n=1 Tax=Nocardioides cavernae TaxID=1921566 RepID=A0A7Y9H112_9ACTN|nr:hypothetical protein [Nocardioides cavernae]NYE36007.1 hypothetical protein [Nocardioides cavernae]
MTTTTLYRLSAVALVLSFVVSLAGGVLHPVVDGQSHSIEAFLAPRSPWAQYLIYAGALLLMLGLPGGYLFFRESVGRLGFVGFATYMLGNALSAMSHLVVEAFVGPMLAADPAARHLVPDSGEIFDAGSFVALQAGGGIVFLLGMLLIGISLVRAHDVPTWVGVVLVAGALALFVPFPERPGLTGLLVELPRGVAVAALGVLVLRRVGRTTSAERELVHA